MADPHRKAKVTGKRRVLTLSERLKIIKAVEDSPHKSRTQMAIDLGVPPPTLSNIMKDKNKYLAQARSGDIVTSSKRARSCTIRTRDGDLTVLCSLHLHVGQAIWCHKGAIHVCSKFSMLRWPPFPPFDIEPETLVVSMTPFFFLCCCRCFYPLNWF